MTMRGVFSAIYLSCANLELGWHVQVLDVPVFDGVHLLVIWELGDGTLLDIKCLFKLTADIHWTECSSWGVAHRGKRSNMFGCWRRLPEWKLRPQAAKRRRCNSLVFGNLQRTIQVLADQRLIDLEKTVRPTVSVIKGIKGALYALSAVGKLLIHI